MGLERWVRDEEHCGALNADASCRLIDSWWDCLGSIRSCGLGGRATSLGVGFELSKVHTIPNEFLTCLLLVDQL